MTVLPEPRSREAHEHVRALREELHRVRAEQPGSGYALDAYVRYMREASLLGLNPTALPKFSPIEADRFFARVVEGPDGHRYWDAKTMSFQKNNGRQRHPRRWWWEHEHEVELGFYDDVTPTCGEERCIFVGHATVGRAAARQLYSDQHMLGGLQVLAMQLGRAPTLPDWAASGRKPSSSNYQLRFGSWAKALRAAGLELGPRQSKRKYREQL